ncbi:hypothetical protein HY636_01695 [Candidatus Woesearchaeota archaeon]|nr:hypothetical protein [Candidatus Woesearchaeota archaeon]
MMIRRRLFGRRIFAKLSAKALRLLYLSPVFLGCGSAATEENNIYEPIKLDADSSYSYDGYEKDIQEKDNIQEEDDIKGHDNYLYETDALNDICNGKVYYKDNDNDGYGIHTDFVMICEGLDIPFSYVLEKKLGWDCNDKNTDVYPAAPETCDNLDNDCNEVVDDVPSSICYTSNEFGSCSGKMSCSGLEMVCDAKTPAKEDCNKKDDNCNGQTDEDLTQKCYTDCGEGLEYCINGTWQDCDATLSSPEICDSIDNDCNKLVDDGLTQPCYTDCGEGLEYCIEGVWQGCTATQPETEICDGKDNNCNKSIDENLTQTCSTICGSGLEYCVNTTWQNCDAPLPKPETCNGIDDDCNGQTDEGVQLIYYQDKDEDGYGNANKTEKACSKPEGYATVPFDCDDNNPKVYVFNQEICNSVDDNCDGQTDEYLTQPCSTICGSGLEYCVNSTWQDCDAPLPKPETCNGIDDNCDTQTDEDLGTTTCGLGECEHTIDNCINGTIQVCDSLEGAIQEECDGIDNNCDGITDEEDICNPLDDLVLHLKFDESQEWINANPKKVEDFSPYQNDGANSGMAHIDGKIGQGIFSEKCYDIDVQHIDAMDFSGGFTIEAWVYPTNDPDSPQSTILHKADIFAHGISFFYDKVKPQHFACGASSSSYGLSQFTTNEFPLNQWYHVACTFDGKGIKLFVNGEEVPSYMDEGKLPPEGQTFDPTSSSKIRIGHQLYQDGRCFYGKLDEIKVWKKPLEKEKLGYYVDK